MPQMGEKAHNAAVGPHRSAGVFLKKQAPNKILASRAALCRTYTVGDIFAVPVSGDIFQWVKQEQHVIVKASQCPLHVRRRRRGSGFDGRGIAAAIASVGAGAAASAQTDTRSDRG